MTANNFGYGYLGPEATSSEYNKYMFMLTQTLARVRTIVPVKVIAVNGGGPSAPPCFVDVQPMVNQIDGQGNATPHGVIFNIPVYRMQGGGNAVICDPEVGDTGWMGVCDRDISAVKTTADIANPGSMRRFALPDGIYMGGILGPAPDQYVAMTSTGLTIVDKNGNMIVTSAAGTTITDSNGNQIQMKPGIVNIITGVLQVNGVPVVVP